MALSERTRPYEILVRVHADAEGKLSFAAHQKTISEVLKDGQVVAAQEGDASPLVPEEAGAFLGPAIPALIAERDAALATLAATEAALAQTIKDHEAAMAQAAQDHAQATAQAAQEADAVQNTLTTQLADAQAALGAATARLEAILGLATPQPAPAA